MMSNTSGANGGQLTVPPGFRFHPTDEELLYYYLRKKVSYESIDLDVIREIDLNKLEPWDLKDKCGIGSGPQNEWYFFSHKDKKYPTGSRTNRATAAGFWKATGRDKAIHHTDTDTKRIGMRKTLVFYTGRAPHGHKTDWIMHEYRLHDDVMNSDFQEEGWVVCRVFQKKAHARGFHPHQQQLLHTPNIPLNVTIDHHKHSFPSDLPSYHNPNDAFTFDQTINPSMHLPQLLSPDMMINNIPPAPSLILSLDDSSTMDHMQSQQNPSRLQSSSGCPGIPSGATAGLEKLSGDWSFLDKLLGMHHQGMDQMGKCVQLNEYLAPQTQAQAQRPLLIFPNSHSFEPDFSRYPK